MAKVYVSSTFLDLKDCRAKVSVALRKVGHEDVAMEYYVAGHERPVERCLADVSECDLYVGLFAWRYGYVPDKENPERLSITEMEYRQARRLGKPCLIFLLSEDAPWPRKFMDKDATQIERLRAELNAEHMTGAFTSPEDVTEAVYPAVYKWSEKHGHLPRTVSIHELDLTAYVNALTRRYQHLDLDALTPPQRDENLRQRLREIFIEQNVRENPPPVELPKEVWEKLQRDREIHPEDLPTGVTPEDVLRARESYLEKPSRPVLDALTDPAHRGVVVLGDPGSGKSTLARYVLLSLLGVGGDERLRRACEGHLPLLIELRSYAGLCFRIKDSTFLDFVEHMSESEGWGLGRGALEDYLRTDGRVVVVFDGLDEIFDPEEREAVARRIAGFAQTHRRARVLVTSRVVGYRRKILTDAEFAHFTLQDLDERQVEQFIGHWYTLALDKGPEEAHARRERIMRSFRESASIRQLAGNPMLLTIMAIIGKNQELPRERWKLYDHATGVLIHHWEVERHLRDRRIDAPFIGQEEKKELLRRLAFRMQSGEGGLAGNYIHRNDLWREFESYLRERFAQPPADATTVARAMIDQFRTRNFILSLHGANLYGFVHRAFLEFFCASDIVLKFEKTKEVTLEELNYGIYGMHCEDQTWHEVLRLICGMIDERFAGVLIEELAARTPEGLESGMPWSLALAWQCLGELRNPSAIESTVNRLVNRTFQFYEKQLFADRRVGKFHHEHILPHVLECPAALVSTKLIMEWMRRLPEFRYTAMSMGTLFDLGKVIGRLSNGSESVRRAASEILNDFVHGGHQVGVFILAEGWRDDPPIASFIRQTASNDTQVVAQETAIWALAEYYSGTRETLSVLLDLGRNSDSDEVRITVLQALCNSYPDADEVVSLLRERRANDSHGLVRIVAANLEESLATKGQAG
jgi:hypothetical protein